MVEKVSSAASVKPIQVAVDSGVFAHSVHTAAIFSLQRPGVCYCRNRPYHSRGPRNYSR